jgi:hypothetical protein
MKKKLLLTLTILIVFNSGYSQQKNKVENKQTKTYTKKQIKEIRKKHEFHLANNNVNKHFNIPRFKRKEQGLPPNQHFEQEWLLSMNPEKGYPTTENISKIRKELEEARQEALTLRIPGDASDNNWIERGPNNVGGRTRAIIFDTQAGANAVVAGAVSGGLWKNADITNPNSQWVRINTLPEHLNIQNIIVDPNNSNIWYVGTGETYVSGDVNGNGLWKTTNRGTTWNRVFGGGTVVSTQKEIKYLNITAPSSVNVINTYKTGLASWPGGGIQNNITAPIVLFDDGTAPNDDACTNSANDYTGKIVLIRRGSCSFESKSFRAQSAGAIGVIIMNNAAGAGAMGMAEDATVEGTIPTISISKEDGDLLVANLNNLTGTFTQGNPHDTNALYVDGVQNINDIAIKNNSGTSELYMAVGNGYYGDSSVFSLFSGSSYGLYKSIDGGVNWSKLNLPFSKNNKPTCPNDIEISPDGNIWIGTTDNSNFFDGGGRVLRSADNGNTFFEVTAINDILAVSNGGGARVEIETTSNSNIVYVLSQLKQANSSSPTVEVALLRVTNATSQTPSATSINLPDSPENRSVTYGFTGQQAFYNLMIEADPTNPEILYVGGLDLFRTTNAATGTSLNWTAISRWTTNTANYSSVGGFNGSIVHSDQHAMTFKPGTPNTAVFGNDGGIYYTSNLSSASGSSTAITSRNSGFNVTQFVGMAVMPNGVAGATGDFFVAGAQDNGTQYFSGSTSSGTSTAGALAGINGALQIQGGDGGKPLFAQDSDKYYITSFIYNDDINLRNIGSVTKRTINSNNNSSLSAGLFYPAMTLDSTNDILYTDYCGKLTTTAAITYQIKRYTNIKTGIVNRTNLSNVLLTTYPTTLNTGKITKTTLYAGTMNGKLLKIVNAHNSGGTWTDLTGSQFIGSVSDIEFGSNDNQIFVTMHNYGVNNIWYTSNGGTNWYRLDGNLPDLPVKCILQNPLNTNEIMIGTDLGVWYANTFNPTTTADQNLDWKQSYNGMSNVKVTDLDLQPNSPTAPTTYNVYAATYGRGVFSGPLSSTLSNPKNEIANNSIKVYPTINNGNITVTSEKTYGETKVELFDISGKKVYDNNININSNSQDINFGKLSTGNYILKLTGENFEGTQKLIIQ